MNRGANLDATFSLAQGSERSEAGNLILSVVPVGLALALLAAPLVGFLIPHTVVVLLSGAVFFYWLSRGTVEVPNLVWPYAAWVVTMIASYFWLPATGNQAAFVSYTGVAAIGGLLIVVSYHAYRGAGSIWLSRALAAVPVVMALGVVSALRAGLASGNQLESLLDARQVETGLGQSNFLAAVIAVVLPHALTGVIARTALLDRTLSAVGVAASLFVVVLSGSRGGLLAVGLSIALTVLFVRRAGLTQSGSGRLVRAALIAALMAAAAGAVVYAGEMIDFLIGRRWASIGTLSGRLLLWEDIFHDLRDGAFLFGTGAGQLTGERLVSFPHNYLLKAWIWAGIPGLVAMILVTVVLLTSVVRYWTLARVVRHLEGGYGADRALEVGAAVAAGILAALVHSLVEITVGSPGFNLFFWTSAGLLVAATEHLRRIVSVSGSPVGPNGSDPRRDPVGASLQEREGHADHG